MKDIAVLIYLFGWIGKIALLGLPGLLLMMKEKGTALFFSAITAIVVIGYSIPEEIAEYYRLRPTILVCLIIAQGVYFSALVLNIALQHFRRKWNARL